MTTKILYVEDNMFSVSLMKLCLQKRPDYDLLIAVDGQSAWEQVLTHMPDLILLDINLPDMSGWDLSRKIRDNPLTQLIPIVAVTSLNRQQSIEESKNAGINLHLNKHVIHSSLISHVEALLSGHLT